MEPVQQRKSKGGRPRKLNKRDRQITVMCSYTEQIIIRQKAKAAGVTPSEYLRTTGINGKIDSSKTELVKELLLHKATFNHAAENLNQFTKKLNSTGELSFEERIKYRNISTLLKEAALLIKTKLL